MLQRALVASAVCAAVLVGSIPVAADEPAFTGLPPVIDVAETPEVPFTVSALEGVCSVRALGAGSVVGSGPYLLILDPTDADVTSLEQTVTIVATSCDGKEYYQQVEIRLPYVVSTPLIVAPWSEVPQERSLRLSVLTPETSPVVISVLRNGQLYRQFDAITGAAELAVPISRDKSSGNWEVQVTSSIGERRRNFTVARHWSVLSSQDARLARFPACSTVTWSYSGSGRPSSVSDPKRDIAGALQRLASVTGLRFKEVRGKADLEYAWADLGSGPVAAAGGGSWTDDGYQASITMNSRSSWLKHAGFGRIAQRGGLPARGYVLLHETGHALGLGHVQNESQVMNTYAHSKSPLTLGKGDRAGLEYLYRPKTCR
jgi:hypothetical protein